MLNKVVVAVDGSDHSRKAVEIAAQLASKGRLVLVHAADESAVDTGMAEMAEVEGLAPDEPSNRPHREGDAPPTAAGPVYIGAGGDVAGQREHASRSAGEAILKQARQEAKRHGVSNVDTILTRGDPAQEILKAAEGAHADAIVVGSRGRSDIAGLVFGSTSHKVLNLADRTCIVVR